MNASGNFRWPTFGVACLAAFFPECSRLQTQQEIVVGAAKGQETQYLRADRSMNPPTIHCYPITLTELEGQGYRDGD